MKKTITIDDSEMKRLQETLMTILKMFQNDQEAFKKFMTDLQNANYDYANKTGFYKILTEEQIAWLIKINNFRKTDEQFNQIFNVMLSSFLLVGVGVLIFDPPKPKIVVK